MSEPNRLPIETNMASDEGSPRTVAPVAPIARRGLILFAVACGAAALLHALFPERVDHDTALFLGLAVAALMFPYVSRFKFGSIEIERLREEVDRQLAPVRKRVGLIETQANLPGRQTMDGTVRPPQASFVASRRTVDGTEPAAVDDDAEWNSDPNHGRFGGRPERNGYRLSAEVRSAAGPDSPACSVDLLVESIDPGRPLAGRVTFHLHPTFGPWKQYDVPVENGTARTTLTSWGAFTVGAVVSGSLETSLELNLATVAGGTPAFYAT